jgi:PAS domain S-box-containing protein
MLTVDSHDLAAYVEQQRSGFLFAIIDEVRDFVFIKDTDSRFLYNNRAHLENMGRTQRDVAGKNDFDLFPAKLAEGFYADETRLFDTRVAVIKIQESVNAQGEKFFTTAIKTIVANPKGQTLGLVGIVRRIGSLDAGGLEESKKHIHETLRRQPGITPGQLHAFEASLPMLFANVSKKADPH